MSKQIGTGFPDAGKGKPRFWADDKQMAQIEGVSKNARGTWFTLTAALLFSAIAVAGVHDRDFFTYDSGLTLPLINFSVPIRSFFAVGPALLLGLYVYLHLYLAKLWRAIGIVRPKLADGRYLDDAVFPWLISDAAIFLKPGGPQRTSGRLSVLVTFLFLWVAGPAVLFFFWWRSFPPHDAILTLWIGLIFGTSLVISSASFCIFMRWMKGGSVSSEVGGLWKRRYIISRFCAFAMTLVIALFGLLRTVGQYEAGPITLGQYKIANFGWLKFGNPEWQFLIYPASLYRAEIVERPGNWLPREEDEAEYWVQFTGKKREKFDTKANPPKSFNDAFNIRRKSRIDGLKTQDFRNWSFRIADGREVFLAGADLRGVDFHGAQLSGATLELADLSCSEENICANLQEAHFDFANLQGANLWYANLKEVNLGSANLKEADLENANLQGANLDSANLKEANLRYTNLKEANLGYANLNEVNLEFANLREADLWYANLKKADLGYANLKEANLWYANLKEANLWETDTSDASFSSASLVSADLSTAINLTQAQINLAYGDATTKLPAGLKRPHSWARETLTRGETNSRWQVWIDSQFAKRRKEKNLNM
jgi:uncharacterized protein YjbI with pentapeptide repeats